MATKQKRNRYRLSEAKAQMVDKLGGDQVEIETDDGATFTLPHPLFYSKEVKAALKPLDDDDEAGIAEVLLGDQYDEFIKHGGDPGDIQFVMMCITDDTRDTMAGRKRPTRS